MYPASVHYTSDPHIDVFSTAAWLRLHLPSCSRRRWTRKPFVPRAGFEPALPSFSDSCLLPLGYLDCTPRLCWTGSCHGASYWS